VECVISIAIYIGIGYYRHTLFHYAWAVAVAPLLLLRTDKSSDWGLDLDGRILRHLFAALESMNPVARPIVAPVAYALMAVAGLTIRVVATVYWLLRRPVYTVSEMPRNWVRQALCTDFHHPPEILPMEAVKGDMDLPPRLRQTVKTQFAVR
jgi:hypothetical protein